MQVELILTKTNRFVSKLLWNVLLKNVKAIQLEIQILTDKIKESIFLARSP